jgi:hypothetical protein
MHVCEDEDLEVKEQLLMIFSKISDLANGKKKILFTAR